MTRRLKETSELESDDIVRTVLFSLLLLSESILHGRVGDGKYATDCGEVVRSSVRLRIPVLLDSLLAQFIVVVGAKSMISFLCVLRSCNAWKIRILCDENILWRRFTVEISGFPLLQSLTWKSNETNSPCVPKVPTNVDHSCIAETIYYRTSVWNVEVCSPPIILLMQK